MSTEGWIFMVGFRVFDVGLLLVWLVWFFHLRDDDDGPSGEEGGGGDGPDPRPGGDSPGGGGLRLPLGKVRNGRDRLRDHRPPRQPTRRRGPEPPVPRPLPARVRRPRTPAPSPRRV